MINRRVNSRTRTAGALRHGYRFDSRAISIPRPSTVRRRSLDLGTRTHRPTLRRRSSFDLDAHSHYNTVSVPGRNRRYSVENGASFVTLTMRSGRKFRYQI
jgi:hypothetical protein